MTNSQVAIARKQLEAEMEKDNERIERTIRKSVKSIGVAFAPRNSVEGGKTMKAARRYRQVLDIRKYQ